MLLGTNPESVISAIWSRARTGDSLDGRKLGLVVEGGAMRGVISAGVLTALEELGLTKVFDCVYGSSGGAVNAAYFLAGQAAYGTTIYYQDINSLAFFNPLRIWKPLDIDYLFSTVITRTKPLLVDRALASPSQFFVALTDATTGEALVAHAQKHSAPLLSLLKASTALPVLYQRTVEIDGGRYWDGGFANCLPIDEAIANGCTDILVLLTQPASFALRCETLHYALISPFLRRSPALPDAYRKGLRRDALGRDLACGRLRPAGVNIATLCPHEDDPRIRRTTKRVSLLKGAATCAASRALEVFGRPVARIVEVLRVFTL